MFQANVEFFYKNLRVFGSTPESASESLKDAGGMFVEARAYFTEHHDVNIYVDLMAAEYGKKLDLVSFAEHTLLFSVVRDLVYLKEIEADLGGLGFTLIAAYAHKNKEKYQEQLDSRLIVVDIEALLEQYGFDIPNLEKSLCLEQIIDKQVSVIHFVEQLPSVASEDLKAKLSLAISRSVEHDSSSCDTPILQFIDLNTKEHSFFCKADYDEVYGQGKFDRVLEHLTLTC